MSIRECSSARAHGFTLIEVMGALVIFSLGVLMVLQVSGALGTRMRLAGLTSELVVLTNQRLDSLEAQTFTSLVVGTASETLTIQGVGYTASVTIDSISPLLKRLDVSLAPTGGGGPSHAVTSYVSAGW